MEGVAGLAGFSVTNATFELLPAGADLVLLAALVAYSGAGGVGNLVLSNWARVMTVLVVWGIIALRLAQPIVLLKISANGRRRHLRHRLDSLAVREHLSPAASRQATDVAARNPRGDGAVLCVLRRAVSLHRHG